MFDNFLFHFLRKFCGSMHALLCLPFCPRHKTMKAACASLRRGLFLWTIQHTAVVWPTGDVIITLLRLRRTLHMLLHTPSTPTHVRPPTITAPRYVLPVLFIILARRGPCRNERTHTPSFGTTQFFLHREGCVSGCEAAEGQRHFTMPWPA